MTSAKGFQRLWRGLRRAFGTFGAAFAIGAAVLGVVGGASIAVADTLRISSIDPSGGTQVYPGVHVWVNNPVVSVNSVAYRAELVNNAGGVQDVTSSVDWKCNLPDNAVFSAPGFVTFSTPARYAVWAELPDPVTGRTLKSNRLTFDTITWKDRGPGFLRPNPPRAAGPDPTTPPVDSNTMKERTRTLLDELKTKGVRVDDKLYSALDNTTIVDDRSKIRSEGTNAEYYRKGLGTWSLSDIGTGMGRFAGPRIFFDSAMAKDLNDGKYFDANGQLTSAAKTMLHELVHAVIDGNGVKFEESDTNIEEQITYAIEQMYSMMNDVMNILNKETLDEQDLTRLKNLLDSLRLKRKEMLGIDSGKWKAEIEKLLQLLGQDDSDGNGIPDWLDLKLIGKNISYKVKRTIDGKECTELTKNPGTQPQVQNRLILSDCSGSPTVTVEPIGNSQPFGD